MEGSVPELKLLFLQMLVILVAARLAGAAFRIVGSRPFIQLKLNLIIASLAVHLLTPLD
jgi:hypothetical protein